MAVNKTVEKQRAEIKELKKKLNDANTTIKQLQDENLTLKDTTESTVNGNCSFQKEGKTYSEETRMFVYDAVVNNVPTGNIPKLLKQFGKRAGIEIGDVPHRNTVELMARELGVVSDLMSAEVLIEHENITLGFDATTQEGVHVNSVHFTTNDKAYIVAVDQLPGGTAEDYFLHISQTIDSLTDTYCLYYSTDFAATRDKIIHNISNTITDRAAVNHATITQLEQNWGKKLNEN